MIRFKHLGYSALFLAVILFAAWLRLQSADTRQMHADEGVQAYQAWKLIETGEYRYDSKDHHGPTLYYLTAWLSPLLSDHTGELSDAGVRRVPFLFSIGALILIFLMRAKVSKIGAFIAALLVAVSPLQIIYGSYFVQEASLAFLTLAFAWAVWESAVRGKSRMNWLVGILAGLMFATKETALIHFAAIGPLALVVAIRKNGFVLRACLFPSLQIGIGFCVVCLLFFSSFFANLQGVVDAISGLIGYTDRAGGQGHEKAWSYYLQVFLPHTEEGIYWSEVSVVALFLLAVFYQLRRTLQKSTGPIETARDSLEPTFTLPAVLAFAGIAMFVIYSIIPYKTPWLMLTPHLFLCIGAGNTIRRGIPDLYAALPRTQILLSIVFAILLLSAGKQNYDQVRNSVFRYHSDGRNPYIYEHTSNPFRKLLLRLDELETYLGPDETLGVFSPDAAWPLPWYLRERQNVAYLTETASLGSYDLELVDSRISPPPPREYYEGAMYELHGLRPNTLLTLRLDKVLWDTYMEKKAKQR